MRNRIGEKYITNEGYEVEIIEYKNWHNCTVKFVKDAEVIKETSIKNLLRGSVKKPTIKIGDIFISNEGYEMEVLEHFSWYNNTVKFNDTNQTTLYNIQSSHLRTGGISNPYHPSVFGVGFIGIGKYNSVNNKIYPKWYGMIERGYCKKYKEDHLTYKDVTVCEEWYNFQNFAKWFEDNWKPHMEGWHLDKDILVKGNKVYSPETCCFVPQEINSLLTKSNKLRGELPIGVGKYKNKYKAYFSINKKGYYLGIFDTAEEAFQAYKTAKEVWIKQVADKWRNQITEQVYQALINYQVEITD
jgi:hypothetical protein